MNEDRRPKSLFFPMLLIALGVFIFLINIGTVSGTTWQNLAQYWPVILIIGGLDGLYKRDGWVGPLVLLGLGTVLLLGNLHYLEYSGFSMLLRLWPIILVAIGLDVLIGHRGSSWSTLLRVLLGFALVGGIVWLATVSPFFSMGLKSVPFEQKLDKAVESEVSITVATGSIHLSGGADDDMLIIGSASLPKEMTLSPSYTKPVNGKSALHLSGNGVVFLPINTTVSPWDFDLNSEIPIELKAELGAGEMRVDLRETKISEFDLEMGVGATVVTLPSGMDINGEVSGAVGELVIRIPKGSGVAIKTDKAIVGSTIPEGYTRQHDYIYSPNVEAGADQITLNVDLAVGGLVIEEY